MWGRGELGGTAVGICRNTRRYLKNMPRGRHIRKEYGGKQRRYVGTRRTRKIRRSRYVKKTWRYLGARQNTAENTAGRRGTAEIRRDTPAPAIKAETFKKNQKLLIFEPLFNRTCRKLTFFYGIMTPVFFIHVMCCKI